MNKKDIIYNYSSVPQGIVGLVIFGFVIFLNITAIVKETYLGILLGVILYLLLFLILNKHMLYKVIIDNDNIVIRYPFNIFGKKKDFFEIKSISTLVYKHGGVNGSSPSIQFHTINGKKKGFICSKQNKDMLKSHFEKYGLELEDNYSSKVKLRKHLKY